MKFGESYQNNKFTVTWLFIGCVTLAGHNDFQQHPGVTVIKPEPVCHQPLGHQGTMPGTGKLCPAHSMWWMTPQYRVLFRFQELGGHNREVITGTLNSDNKGLKGLNNPVLFYTLWCYVIHCSKKFFINPITCKPRIEYCLQEHDVKMKTSV